METYKKFKIEQNAVRVYIFAVGICMTFYCALLCFGIRHVVAELVFLISAYLLLFGGAWMYRLCWLSYSFITYTLLCRICQVVYAEGFFDGEWMGYQIIDIAHVVMLVIGLVLTVCFLFRFKQYVKLIKG